jgi:hypothetical protein
MGLGGGYLSHGHCRLTHQVRFEKEQVDHTVPTRNNEVDIKLFVLGFSSAVCQSGVEYPCQIPVVLCWFDIWQYDAII